MKKLSSRFQAYVFLLINVVTWGAALPIVKLGLSDTTPFRYLFYRFALAIILSLPVLFYFLPKIKNLRTILPRILLLELIGTTLALSLLYIGLTKTTALEASLITTTTPLFITLGGIWFLQEKEERQEWMGLFIAFIATLAMTFLPAFFSGQHMFGGTFTGNALIFTQNIATAVYFLLAKRWYKKIPALFVSTISFYVGFVTFAVLSLFEVGGSVSVMWQSMGNDLTHPFVWLIAFYMALFGSIIGLTAYIKGQNRIEASEASMFGYLQPLVYIPLSYLLLKESATVLQVVPLFFILIGVYISQKRSIVHFPNRTRSKK